jgi:asparagine synthase (glutamine-hydrolysing)
MLEVMRHRGPDDLGVHVDTNVAIGQTRLSIIDVVGGKQPIYNEEGDGLVVCNGEIYNHQALRKRLEHHSFRTHSDTETIIHLFEELGPRCIEFLDGMFAFATHKDGELFVGRDPLGIKPLYYAVEDGRFYFASEMKALLKVTNNIREFPPGHYYTTSKGFRRYYSVPEFRGELAKADDVAGLVRESLTDAVEKRLMSDVPLGVYLSGGLDSSIVAALAKRSLPELHTFSVGVAGSHDLAYAERAAQKLGTIHHTYVYDEDEVLDHLKGIIYHLESYDYALVRSAIPNFFVSHLAHGKAKVILSGEGADEVFSGYHYLKKFTGEDLHHELWRITSSLHNLNLQRCDRMTMAHSLEGRVPFLDTRVIETASRIPLDFKLGPNQTEKWILRVAFKDRVPDEVLWRRKEKFSEGAGSMLYLKDYAERQISDQDLAEAEAGKLPVRSKEELLYYRIFTETYPETLLGNIGHTSDVEGI